MGELFWEICKLESMFKQQTLQYLKILILTVNSCVSKNALSRHDLIKNKYVLIINPFAGR